MSEVESAATELKTQYAAQVAGDLERNTREQERIGAEVGALEEQLRALRHDRSLLAELQRALGGDSPAGAGPNTGKSTAPAPSVPRQASAATAAGRRKKATSTKPAAKPAASKPAAAKSAAGKPTLVELIREHLGRQNEPRSSAEVATGLAEAHPDREIKPKVVRTTVEGLVARGQVQRTKQGSSVFYTVPGTAAEQAPDTA
ncbi:hypothetical protein AB0D14_23795 [Streptomyces sp. NPDC048484]|uniref:hypothetical protein n=1 Tax=Streptomyces sp. NPDC048484 TaxID=3155146 RepID=UPI003443491A